MKKKLFIFLIFIIILSFYNTVNAYSTNEFSIDIANTYSEISEGVFLKENGDNINIVTSTFSGKSDNPYTEENLNDLVNELKKQINSNNENLIREEVKKQNSEYGLGIAEDDIDNYAKSIKIDSINTKEITTVTPNNYKCFHIIANFSVANTSRYIEQYYIISGNNIFTISIATNDKNNLESNETKTMIDSFKIYNYKEPSKKGSFFSDELLTKMIASAILVVISSLIGVKKQKDKKSDIKLENEEDKQLEKLIDNIERNNKVDSKESKKEKNIEDKQKYCTKCGKEIENEWTFCNYCGNKLK